MINLSVSRLTCIVCAALLAGGIVSCKGHESKAGSPETTRHIVQAADTMWLTIPDDSDDSTPPDLQVAYNEPTKFQVAKGTQPDRRIYELDGEAWLIVRHADRMPVVIRTRQLVITLQSPYARLHIDAFASSPGEQADLLEGQLKVTKAYHSTTDNEPETLKSGDMVMINKEIDLMEKETLDSAERKKVKKGFPKPVDTARHS